MRRILTVVVVAAVAGGASWVGYRRLCPCNGCGALDSHHDTWQSLHLTDYSYVYEEGGMACCYRVRITVHGDRVVQSHLLQSLGEFSNRPTVDDVFARARHEMRSANHVTVQYDRTYGFPVSVNVDPNDHAKDDEHGFRIEQFRRLAPINA